MRPGKRRALPYTPLGRILEKIEYYKASVRAKVEHPFHIIKKGSRNIASCSPQPWIPSPKTIHYD